ncbi:hypothetical protein KORDIASMS9_00788 [Kordia sp. SMS9]|uniref:hypothetical protein n=1 Tax=Kordia sp. SMS9 TaxID=2282170 RepID=UPI000E0D379D|nr:hypothetical protein [Kordia sp. SMS9]AXG68573.1 hypothetical protein KORDIASMS9_00788 [Kordia sp. SMS9]
MNVAYKKKLTETIITILVIVILTAVGIFFLRKHADKEGKELMSAMDAVSQLHSEQGIRNCITTNDSEEKRMIILNSALQNYKEQHEVTFLKLYTYHFTSMTLFLLFSILSALTVFIITQEGWKGTSHTVKVLFLVFTSLTSFFGLSASTFDQEKSIHRNGKAFINYDNLQKRLFNYCATGIDIDGDSISFTEMHTEVMKEASDLHDFYLEFDEQNLETKNIFNFTKEEKEEAVQE